jgi:uncharacterized Zn finger protein (UPF0148 family)
MTELGKCPACFTPLPPLKPGEKRLRCPRCQHLFDARDARDVQTGAHTPAAKRSSRPPPWK